MATMLHDAWDVNYHLCDEKAWDLGSYKPVQKGVQTVEEIVYIAHLLDEQLLKKCMFFVMRSGITPQWEDPKNRNGGCFSFKVLYKSIACVWKHLFYAVTGESLCTDPRNNALVNGITISPKKNFCIIKIWFADCSFQDPQGLVPLPQLSISGCLFKKHEPEF